MLRYGGPADGKMLSDVVYGGWFLGQKLKDSESGRIR
jgi:hypothetical protein